MATPDPRDASFSGNVFRANFKSVIAKRSDLTQIDGGRLKAPAAGQKLTLHAGQVLAQITAAGPDFGKLVPYANGGANGAGVPVGVLEMSTEADEFGNGTLVSVIRDGILYRDMLVGLDAAAVTALRASVFTENGNNLIHVRA